MLRAKDTYTRVVDNSADLKQLALAESVQYVTHVPLYTLDTHFSDKQSVPSWKLWRSGGGTWRNRRSIDIPDRLGTTLDEKWPTNEHGSRVRAFTLEYILRVFLGTDIRKEIKAARADAKKRDAARDTMYALLKAAEAGDAYADAIAKTFEMVATIPLNRGLHLEGVHAATEKLRASARHYGILAGDVCKQCGAWRSGKEKHAAGCKNAAE